MKCTATKHAPGVFGVSIVGVAVPDAETAVSTHNDYVTCSALYIFAVIFTARCVAQRGIAKASYVRLLDVGLLSSYHREC